MAKITPFKAIRPTRDKAYLVSSKPAYTYKKKLLDAKLESNPYTFLHVINPEYRLDDKTKPNTRERFYQVKKKFIEFCENGILIQDKEENLYIHRQITPTNTYLGIIAGASVEDYLNGKIKIHENTFTKREETFKMYLDVCEFNAEPVLLTYKDTQEVDAIIDKYLVQRSEYEFNTTQEIKHDLWVVKDKNDIAELVKAFENIDEIYIADGHHRSASSVLYAQHKEGKKNEKSNFFLACFIPESKLNIIAFNRAVYDLNGLQPSEFLNAIEDKFIIEEKKEEYTPVRLHNFSMFFQNKWYSLTAKEGSYSTEKIIEQLDAQILSDNILSPILGITDLKTDNRIGFIEGTKGSKGLKKAVESDKAIVAFGLYPVSVEQLKNIADTGNTMPPKSTYIEPKMRSGLTIYDLSN